jgi:hypothetical protein
MRPAPIVLSFALLLPLSCSTERLAGGISDHGNELVGVVVDRNGRPVAGASASILPDDYNHFTDSARIASRSVLTDDSGRFLFDSLDEGAYTVRAQDDFSGTGGVIRSVASDPRDSGAADTMVLNNTGSIYFEADSLSLSVGLIVYLPGLPLYGSIDSTKITTFSGVPSGLVALRAYDPMSATTVDLGHDYLCIEIIPGASLMRPTRSPTPFCLRGDTVFTCLKGFAGEQFTFSPIHPRKRVDGNYQYRFSWGEGSISDWGFAGRWKWTWNKPGFYSVQSQVMRQGVYLAWSDPLLIEIVARE